MLRPRMLIPFLLFLIISPSALSSVSISSFNIKHLGWGDSKDYPALAQVINHFDLVAIQEVMSEDAVAKLAETVSSGTGEKWRYMTSHLIGRGSYKEAYTMMWRDSAVEYVDGAVVFIDNRDKYAREPFSARFREKATGLEFAVANVHILYGDSVSDRTPEIRALADYWQWLGEVYGDTPRLLMGDFNYAPDGDAWQPLKALGAAPAITQGATTLSPRDGRYANLYDNIWHTPGALPITEAGILRFPDILGISHEEARDTVSDHAPVYVVLEGGELNLSRASSDSFDTSQAAANDSCIDLNRSNASTLAELPHIGTARANRIIESRPWRDVRNLTNLNGIGNGRLGDILDSGLLCTG